MKLCEIELGSDALSPLLNCFSGRVLTQFSYVLSSAVVNEVSTLNSETVLKC